MTSTGSATAPQVPLPVQNANQVVASEFETLAALEAGDAPEDTPIPVVARSVGDQLQAVPGALRRSREVSEYVALDVCECQLRRVAATLFAHSAGLTDRPGQLLASWALSESRGEGSVAAAKCIMAYLEVSCPYAAPPPGGFGGFVPSTPAQAHENGDKGATNVRTSGNHWPFWRTASSSFNPLSFIQNTPR
eukprot:CAMPEP_0170366112 /NCGR_PEP_ID=MMETSP0117_2-20130122/6250_1 /TAXON_ID=400756 /ORGANISM="Durinskia baltica, Strain CSIRO CS-38" /LENGTH=191 /DNA_ID=CAMNT_0010620691 /DNA_START=168 /DNA_END=741 /DNA_ORIENTATION=-